MCIVHSANIHDAPHFLRRINQLNSGPKLPPNYMVVRTDITGAYTIIPYDDGSKCLEEALEEKIDQPVPTNFLVKLMDFIQKNTQYY